MNNNKSQNEELQAIIERAKALREKQETWRRAYNKVVEEHDKRIDKEVQENK